jgi:hypothetical protein
MYSSYLNASPTGATPDLIEGLLMLHEHFLIDTIPNVGNSSPQALVVTPSVAVQEATMYRLTEMTTGQSIKYQSDANPSATEVVAGLIAAWNANSILNGLGTAKGTNTLEVSVRGFVSGIRLELVDGGSTPTNQLTVTNNAAKGAERLKFGRGLVVGEDGKPKLPTGAIDDTTLKFAGCTTINLADYVSEPAFTTLEVNGYYTANQAVGRLKTGQICVKSPTPVNPTLPVFLSYDVANGTQGTFRSTAAPNYSQLPMEKACWAKNNSAGLVLLNIDVL